MSNLSPSSAPSTPAALALAGTVHGGQQPISGATIKLFQVGTTAVGTGSSNLLTKTVVTDGNGGFNITGAYPCPAPTTQVYIAAIGGNPGLTAGTNNAAILLIAALGDCSTLSSTSFISLNEATTVATAYGLAQFLGPAGAIGGPNATGLRNAFFAARNLVDTAVGAAPGAGLPQGATLETAKLYTLADALAGCVNSDGTIGCNALFSASTVSGVTPTNILDAALAIVRNPAIHQTAVMGAVAAQGPFQPTLSGAPADWTMSVSYPGGGLNAPTAVAVDGSGNIWVANYTGGAVSEFSTTGSPVSANGFGTGLAQSYGIAIDSNESVWVTGETTASSVNAAAGSVTEFNPSGQIVSGSGYTGGGVSAPLAIAADPNGKIWVADYGISAGTLLNPDGSAVSTASGFGGSWLPSPLAVAVDASHNAWFAVEGAAVRVSATGSVASFPCCANPSGIAVDQGGNVWLSDYSESRLVELSPSGAVLHTPTSTGGLNHPQAIAIDGTGTVWATNYSGNAVTAVSGYASSNTGTSTSPSAGYGTAAGLSYPFGLAVDASGNLWVASSGNSLLTEFVGVASPVATPLPNLVGSIGTHALTVTNGTGTGSYAPGTPVTVAANAPATGCHFTGWTGSTAALANAAAATTVLTMPSSAAAITSTYAADPGSTYTLTVLNGTGSGTYASGTAIAVAANAAPSGYTFSEWSGTTGFLANVTSASTSFTMPASAATIGPVYLPSTPPVVSPAQTDIVGVQFPQYSSGVAQNPLGPQYNYSAGVFVAQNWNVADTNGGTSPASNAGVLIDSAGNSTAIGFTLSGYTSNDSTNDNNFPQAGYTETGGLADQYLVKGSTYNSSGAPITLQLSGLSATQPYSLVLYVTSPYEVPGGSANGMVKLGGTSYYISTSNTLGTWTRAVSTNSSAPATGNYVRFDNISGSSTATVTVTGAYVGLAGFQLVANPPPVAAVTPPQTPIVTLPTLPNWSLTIPQLQGGEPQMIVGQASQTYTTAAPGQTININANFYTPVSLPLNYTLYLYIVNSAGTAVATVTNDMNSGNTIIPSTSWLGPVSIATPITVPSVADGTYYLMTSLIYGNRPILMSPGSGVVQDSAYRYYIGVVNVKSRAAQPTYLPPPTLDLTGYTLTFDDEFTTLSLSDSLTYDGSNWYTLNEQCCMQVAPPDNSQTAMVGLASQYNPYSLVQGGGLDIRLQKNGNLWTSGVMTSVDGAGKGFSQQYGYFEMKAQLPTGLDTWPAFWLLNTASKSNGTGQGEIDIMEYISNPGFPNNISSTVHDYTRSTNTAGASHNLVTLPTNGFHTYGMLWTPTTTTFYFDGAVTFEMPTPSSMQQPYYLLVDLGIGSGYPTLNTPTPDDLIVQYVRAYAKK